MWRNFLRDDSTFMLLDLTGFQLDIQNCAEPLVQIFAHQAQFQQMTSGVRGTCSQMWVWRNFLIVFLTPVIFLPIVVVFNSSETKCAYVVILMAAYWLTESLPVGVTALIPVFLFPLFEILSPNEVAAQYVNDVTMLLIGGLVMALAVEHWDLHRRLALKCLMMVGSDPRWLMLGMMLATWFLSMWISNSASTAMMIPIAEAILIHLRGTSCKLKKVKDLGLELEEKPDHKTRTVQNGNTEQENDAIRVKAVEVLIRPVKDGAGLDGGTPEVDDLSFARLCKGMSLCICYAANAGGIATLTGTGPNIAMKGHTDLVYAKYGLTNPINFTRWMAFGFPLSVVILLVCWGWLLVAFIGCRVTFSCWTHDAQDGGASRRIKGVIKAEYDKLGPMVPGQVMTLLMFLLLVILWITRDLGGAVGWGSLFKPAVKDGAAAILIAVLLFALPSVFPCWKSPEDPARPQNGVVEDVKGVVQESVRYKKSREIQPLLTWRVVSEKTPWHLILLLGGGFALSKGCDKSGLSAWIGHQLKFVSGWNKWGVLVIICYITSAATEVASNVAVAQLLMPIVSQLALTTGIHPLYYVLPTAIASSFAFMLPIATPPNAIVFAYGRVRILDMAATGLVLNFLSVPCLVAVTGTIGNAIFDLDNVPDGFLNQTLRN